MADRVRQPSVGPGGSQSTHARGGWCKSWLPWGCLCRRDRVALGGPPSSGISMIWRDDSHLGAKGPPDYALDRPFTTTCRNFLVSPPFPPVGPTMTCHVCKNNVQSNLCSVRSFPTLPVHNSIYFYFFCLVPSTLSSHSVVVPISVVTPVKA